jgi:hypothetical protein
MIGFKAVAVNKSKINRIQLHKKINLTKDEEGESALILETMKQDLEDNFKIHYEDDLIMDQVISMPSHEHLFLQFADLFVAALNGKYNSPGDNNKDMLAEYILETVRVNEIKFSATQVETDTEKVAEEIDHSVLFIFD